MLHLLQGLLQPLQARPQATKDQLSHAVSVAIHGITRGAAVVVAVQRGSALQAHGQVAGLTEEPQLLAGVEAAEQRAADTTPGLQLLQSLNRVRGCSLLAPADRKDNTHMYNDGEDPLKKHSRKVGEQSCSSVTDGNKKREAAE